jgi:O-antigen/teichoic acid export membrane protein
MLNMAGRSTWSLFNNGISLAIDLVLDLILIPKHGIVGAAVAWAIAIIVGNVLATWQVRASMGISSFGTGSVAIGAVALVCYGAIPLAARLLFGASVGVSIVSVSLGTLLYLEGLRRTRGLLHLHALTSMVRRRHGRGPKIQPHPVDQISYTPTATWVTDWNAEISGSRM